MINKLIMSALGLDSGPSLLLKGDTSNVVGLWPSLKLLGFFRRFGMVPSLSIGALFSRLQSACIAGFCFAFKFLESWWYRIGDC